MIDVVTLSGPVGATLLVVAILVQSVALYVGYGVLERVATSRIETNTDT